MEKTRLRPTKIFENAFFTNADMIELMIIKYIPKCIYTYLLECNWIKHA